MDDVELNRALLGQMFQREFQIVEAGNGREGIGYLEAHTGEVVLVLLDIRMPVVDGYGVMEYMRSQDLLQHIPVILITEDARGDALERGYTLGAIDVIFKPFRRSIVVQRARNVIELFSHKNHLEHMVKRQTEVLQQQYRKMRNHHNHLVRLVYEVVHCRNTESPFHVQCVQGYTRILARHYGSLFPEESLTPGRIDMIVQAAGTHDVGKITIPDSILTRQGKLLEPELELLKSHTVTGGKMMQVMAELESREYNRICYNICQFHHERYDGSGYPNGLRADAIPVEAQLVGLADMYDALVNAELEKRVPRARAYYMLMQGECGALAPRIRDCLEDARGELERFECAAG
jgi:putative two-component system response regulator